MGLHRSEWLEDAKKVPVGQHRRVYHGAEPTPALVLWNNEDSWSCYCHRCHEGGKVYKQVLEKVDESVPVYRKYFNLKDTCSLSDLASKHPDKYKRMVLLLHDKGMSTALFKGYNVKYNLVDDRLCFIFNGVVIGRDCRNTGNAKWLMYHSDNQSSHVYLQGRKTGKTCEPVIFTEDLFSAIKVNHYTGFSTLWIQGTRLSDDIILRFIEPINTMENLRDKSSRLNPVAVLSLDSDSAGYSAVRSITNRFNLLGLPIRNVDIPVGLDPKDLKPHEMINIYKHLEDL